MGFLETREEGLAEMSSIFAKDGALHDLRPGDLDELKAFSEKRRRFEEQLKVWMIQAIPVENGD